MLARNEWDPVKSIIVGIADDATIPTLDASLRLVNYASEKIAKDIPTGPYPQQVIDEANEDLEKLCDYLRSLNIEVFRPDKNFKPNYYNYCPRDTVVVYDDKIIAAPMPLKARITEFEAMRSTLEKFRQITVIPNKYSIENYNHECVGNPDILALNEYQPLFDAANILRANDELYYLVSNSGNKKGLYKLREILPDATIHPIEKVYSYMHLDSTIAFLREGLMLLNPKRIKTLYQLPEPLRNWDVIWAPDPVDIGHYPGLCNASPWINVNLLSVNPNLAIVEEHQIELARELEKKKIEVKLLPMRHARTLGGCFHCVTLDIERG